MMLVYSAAAQIRKIRILMWFFWACAAAAAWNGVHLFQTHGLNFVDGGELTSIPMQLAWGITVCLLGIAPAVGMWIYGSRCIVEISFEAAQGKVFITTLGTLAPTRLVTTPRDIRSGPLHGVSYGNGRTCAGMPWHSIRIRGKKSTYFLDMHGKVLNEALMQNLIWSRCAA